MGLAGNAIFRAIETHVPLDVRGKSMVPLREPAADEPTEPPAGAGAEPEEKDDDGDTQTPPEAPAEKGKKPARGKEPAAKPPGRYQDPPHGVVPSGLCWMCFSTVTRAHALISQTPLFRAQSSGSRPKDFRCTCTRHCTHATGFPSPAVTRGVLSEADASGRRTTRPAPRWTPRRRWGRRRTSWWTLPRRRAGRLRFAHGGPTDGRVSFGNACERLVLHPSDKLPKTFFERCFGPVPSRGDRLFPPPNTAVGLGSLPPLGRALRRGPAPEARGGQEGAAGVRAAQPGEGHGRRRQEVSGRRARRADPLLMCRTGLADAGAVC